MTAIRRHVLEHYRARGWDVSTGWPRVTPDAQRIWDQSTRPRLEAMRAKRRRK